jgi:hypothetical protein
VNTGHLSAWPVHKPPNTVLLYRHHKHIWLHVHQITQSYVLEDCDLAFVECLTDVFRELVLLHCPFFFNIHIYVLTLSYVTIVKDHSKDNHMKMA